MKVVSRPFEEGTVYRPVYKEGGGWGVGEACLRKARGRNSDRKLEREI